MDEGGPLRSLVLGEFNPVANWGKWNVAISSELVRVEVMRAVERLHVMQQITNDAFAELSRVASTFLAQLRFVPMNSVVLRRAAGHFPTVISAPDAIHLATALLWQEDADEELTFLTHDRQPWVAARACGLATGPTSKS